MQVTAEIHLGTRTVLEYLLSPVRKAFHEAGLPPSRLKSAKSVPEPAD